MRRGIIAVLSVLLFVVLLFVLACQPQQDVEYTDEQIILDERKPEWRSVEAGRRI